ncbi:MAG: response regulator [Actinobacteria bacterium]|nr:response regulator [Actinomycetota bacterium]
MKNVRLILVEDDAFTRATLGDALAHQGFDVKARVATAAEALAAQKECDPQVAVLDLDLGIGPTGIDVAIALRSRNPKIGIVFLTTYKDPRLIESNLPSLPEGAIYLNKLEMNSTSTIAMQISLAMLKPLAKRSLYLPQALLDCHQRIRELRSKDLSGFHFLQLSLTRCF